MLPGGTTNIALGIIAICLLVIVIISQQDSTPHTAGPFSSPDETSTIRITRGGDDIISLKREGQRWYIEHPNGSSHWIAANPQKIAQLQKLLTIKSGRAIENHTQRAKYGLDPVVLSVSINGATIQFGTTDPIHRQRYIATERGLFLVEDKAYPVLIADRHQFISKSLFDSRQTIVALSIDNIPIFTNEDSTTTKLTQEQTQILIDAWRYASALDVVSNAEFEPQHRVNIAFDNATELELSTRIEDNRLQIHHHSNHVTYLLPIESAAQLLVD